MNITLTKEDNVDVVTLRITPSNNQDDSTLFPKVRNALIRAADKGYFTQNTTLRVILPSLDEHPNSAHLASAAVSDLRNILGIEVPTTKTYLPSSPVVNSDSTNQILSAQQ